MPPEWVFRRHTPDYGTDGEVEIFDDNGSATGLKLNVQVKATDFEDDNLSHQINLKAKTCQYYVSLDLPVLLVRYISATKRLYVKWFHHSLDMDRIEQNKYFIINFTENDAWDNLSPTSIIYELKTYRKIRSASLTLPLPLSIQLLETRILNMSQRSLANVIEKGLEIYPNLVAVNKIILASENRAEENDILTIIFSGENLSIRFGVSPLLEIPYTEISSPEEKERFINDILFSIGIALKRAGQYYPSGFFIKKSFERTCLLSKISFFLDAGLCLAVCGRLDDLIYLMEACSERKDMALDSEALSFCIIANFDNMSLKQQQKWHDAMYAILKVASEENDPSRLSALHYSIGNMMRTVDLKKSFSHYCQAKRLEPDYLNRAYYWKDIGGILFEKGKYSLSNKAYSCAYELSGDEDILVLKADSLMYAGRYEESLKLFEKCAGKGLFNEPYWCLKKFCLKGITKSKKMEYQKRDRVGSSNILSVLLDGDLSEEKSLEIIENALECDLIDENTWFNLGIIQSNSNDTKSAFYSFLTAAVLARVDTEGWCNTICLAFQPNIENDLVFHILASAYKIHGNDLFERLDVMVEDQDDKEKARELVDRIYEMVKLMGLR